MQQQKGNISLTDDSKLNRKEQVKEHDNISDSSSLGRDDLVYPFL